MISFTLFTALATFYFTMFFLNSNAPRPPPPAVQEQCREETERLSAVALRQTRSPWPQLWLLGWGLEQRRVPRPAPRHRLLVVRAVVEERVEDPRPALSATRAASVSTYLTSNERRPSSHPH